MSNAIAPAMYDGELRILDTDLATRLGFGKPENIRKLIERHERALSALGLISTVEINTGQRGRPGKANYLNKKQAIFITAKSETSEATEITIEIIEKFDSYERGAIMAPKARRIRKSSFDVVFKRCMTVLSYRTDMDDNQKQLAAARGAYNGSGINPFELMGITSLSAPDDTNYMTPTQIGEQIGLSGQAVNLTLIQQGYQAKVIASASGSDYEPTEKGRELSRFFDTTRRYGKGSQQQLKWSPRMVAILRPFAKRPEPAS